MESSAVVDCPIWAGPSRPCRSLLVLPRSRDLGDELRVIRFVAHAARDVEQVTALVERRLIPLLTRSFPQVRFIDRSTDLDLNSFSHVAAQERLAYWYGHDDEAIAASFLPLIPPPSEDEPRGIGLSWYSRVPCAGQGPALAGRLGCSAHRLGGALAIAAIPRAGRRFSQSLCPRGTTDQNKPQHQPD